MSKSNAKTLGRMEDLKDRIKLAYEEADSLFDVLIQEGRPVTATALDNVSEHLEWALEGLKEIL